MRYTTSAFGEVVRCIGRFASGLLSTQVQLSLYNLETGAAQAITTPNCTEIAATAVGGRSIYVWPSSNITVQPTVKTEFLYVMQDTTTGQIQEGKIVLGGFPDQSAISRYESVVHIDTTGGGVAGTAYPIGTPTVPVNNVTDARTIADALGIRQYHVNGAITLTANHDNWTFAGEEPRQDIITIQAGVSVADSSFDRIGIRGSLTGAISASECLIGPTVGGTLGIDGVFTDCGFQGTIRLANGATFRGLRVNWLDLGGTIIDFNTPSSVTQFLVLCAGNVNFRNANINTVSGIVNQGGILTHESTCVNSTAYLFGQGEWVDSATSWLSINDFLIRGSRIDIETSTRSAPGDEMDLVTDAVDAAALAPTGVSELSSAIDTLLGTNHGAGSWATAVGFATTADVQRLYNENVETVIFTATAAIVAGQNGRNVPSGGISHVRVRVKADGAANWSAPVDTYYVVFNYFSGATANDRAAAAATQAAAPVDGTFASTTPP